MSALYATYTSSNEKSGSSNIAEALKEFQHICEKEKENQSKDRSPWPFCNAAACNFGM